MTLELLASDVFRNAMITGTVAATVCAVVGTFVVLRAQAFAAESLLDVCFAGAAGAALLGISPAIGMAVFGIGAALGIGALGEQAHERSVEIGMVVTFALGVGALFLGFYAHESAFHSRAGMAILFGSLVSVRAADLLRMGALVVPAVGVLAFLYRPLLFSTVDPEAARARGVPVRLVSMLFLVVVAAAAAAGAMAVGVLLATSLLVAPPAAAVRLAQRPGRTLLLSICLGIGIAWAGILIAFLLPPHPPVGFTVSALAAAAYFGAVASRRNLYSRRGRTVIIGDSAETGQWTSRKGTLKRGSAKRS